MKRLVLVLLLTLLSVPSAFAGDAPQILLDNVSPWAPKAIVKEKDKLSIVLDQRKITPTIYEAIMTSGVCYASDKDLNVLSGVNQVEILNTFGRQGYVFTGNAAICRDILDASKDLSKILLMGNSRLY